MTPTRLFRPTDVAVSAALGAIGVVVAGGAWFVAAGRSSPGAQAAPAGVAAIGLALGVAAGALWVRAGRRAVRLRRFHLIGDGAPAPVLAGARTSTELVAGPGLARFHRADCPIASGHRWKAGSRAAHLSAGRAPCSVCRP